MGFRIGRRYASHVYPIASTAAYVGCRASLSKWFPAKAASSRVGFTAEPGDFMVTSPRDGAEPRIYSPLAFAKLFEPIP